MKKKTIVLFILFILTCGGLFMNYKINEDQQKGQERLDLVAKEQEPYIEKYLNYNFNGIDTIEITNVKNSPTNTIYISGYINNDKELDFVASFESSKPGSNMGLSIGQKFAEMAKPEAETPAKNMEEILKEERKKKRAEEKTSSTQNWFNI